jgi:hypothetical protein
MDLYVTTDTYATLRTEHLRLVVLVITPMNTQVEVIKVLGADSIRGANIKGIACAKLMKVVCGAEGNIVDVSLVVALTLQRTILKVHFPKIQL